MYRRRVARGLRRKVLPVLLTACALLTVCGFSRAQNGIPAASPVTSGSGTGQAGMTPTTPSAVPQAATAPAASAATPAAALAAAKPDPTLPPLSANLAQYAGLQVVEIRYVGVEFDKTDRLQGELTQKQGEPLDPEKVRQTTRRLFATGRYRNIDVRVEKTGASGVTVIFGGIARFYVGRIQVNSIKEERLTSLVEYGTKLNPGAPFTNADVTAATESVKQVLASNGYYEPKISVKTDRDRAGQQVNVTYTIAVGPQAKVGTVVLQGKDPGITEAEFRKKGKLKGRTRVTHETASTALTNMRTYFQKKNRLEATVSLQKSVYDANTKALNYTFAVEQGPIVKVEVDGAKLSKNRLHLLVPIYEEGTIDIDLLNESTFNMKDYLQQQGFFDAVVKVKVEGEDTPAETVLFQVDKGAKHKVIAVDIDGAKYFPADLLKQSLKVQKADAYQRSGRFSQQLVNADEKTIQSLYRANGFNAAKVTADIKDVDDDFAGHPNRVAQISVRLKVDEGAQQKFGDVALNGVDAARKEAIRAMMNSATGQPFSLITLSADRDAILGYYLSNGFDQARIEVIQTVEAAGKNVTDVGFNVTEGEQVFIGRVLESGIHYTHPSVVNNQLRVHAGDPLDQSALLETQRNLYNLALFNEVNAAVQNPNGDAELKNVLVQVTEARRWDVTYGFGLEAQTGTPACQYCTKQGSTAAQQGKAGVSPRVSVDIGRINLRGTDDTLALHTSYGLLERIATLTFQNPHLYGHPNLAAQLSGGYSNVQDITTFKSSKLQGDLRVTQKATRKDTFIYDFEYRRISVDPNSLAISSNLIPILSQPVRVGGPGITWFHDTRTPSPLDAGKGSYTSVQDFIATSIFGSQTQFNRSDITNSTYYTFGKRKYVFARKTRVGFIESFGVNQNINSPSCAGILLTTNATCNAVPLPERLYAGGEASHRGFPINGAGPRDLQTGYPVGGSAVFVNTLELRLPAPVLPYVGDSINFVIFHDMGNVFQHVGDMLPSLGRFHQPNEQTCEVLTAPIGTCDFNYTSHAIGLGLRYKTPVGPIRVDFPFNLNPPRYPVITGQSNIQPYVGVGSRFNFFFSIGQSF